MNNDMKLILMGLLATLLTIVVFTVIEAALIAPRSSPEIPLQSPMTVTQAAGNVTAQATFTSAPAIQTRTFHSTPALLLTMPGEPFSSTSTATQPAGLSETPESSPALNTKGTPSVTAASGQTPSAGVLQPTAITPTDPNIPSGTAGIQGRVLFNGALFSGTIVLKLVDPVLNDIQLFTFMDGEYNLNNLQPTQKGYQVVFSRDDNLQLSQNQVTAQVMVGPLPAEEGALIRYPDIDIALLGLEPEEPEPDTVLDQAITPQQPLRFSWSDYPSLSQYQLELKPGRLSQPVWISGYVSTESVVFDGVLSNGAMIERGTYWWSVSGRTSNGAITVVGPVTELALDW
jgi:hypothetical protein